MTKILIKTLNANTSITVNDGIPDYVGITEPTLSILQQAVDNGDYEIIPDPEPYVESPQPNWDSFYDALIMSEVYDFLFAKTVSDPSITGAMTAIGIAIIKGQLEPNNPDRFNGLQAAVNAVLMALIAIEQPLTTEQLSQVRNLLDAHGFNGITLG